MSYTPEMLGKLIRLPLRLIPSNTVVPVLSGMNKGKLWKVGSSTHGCWLGIYERAEQEAIQGLVKPGSIAWDLGANAGFYTLWLSKVCKHVYAFEPLPENAYNLSLHLRLNHVQNVTLLQTAVSDRIGLTGFDGEQSEAHISENASFRVPTTTLDTLLSRLPVPDFIKCDIEGAEGLMLAGAQQLLALRKTTWLVSLHMPGIQNTFAAAGYSVRHVTPSDIVATPK